MIRLSQIVKHIRLFIFQLAFVNNPLGGAMILAVIFSTNWKIGIGSVLGGSVATVAEMVSDDVTSSCRRLFGFRNNYKHL